MLETIFAALIHMGTPARWSRWPQRLFVLLSPITVPLLIFVWMVITLIIITILATGCVWAIAANGWESLRGVFDQSLN